MVQNAFKFEEFKSIQKQAKISIENLQKEIIIDTIITPNLERYICYTI